MPRLTDARTAGLYGAALIAVLLIAASGAAYLKAAPKEEGGTGTLSYASRDKEKEVIAALLAAHPSEEAYRLFKERYQGYSYEAQHVVAHIFGELLYKKEGVPGIAVCDGDFGFGCYHSFFGLAIAERGPAVARELDEACFQKFGRLGTGCPHGIGHGLMWYFGDEKLEEALASCDGMHYTEPIGGCTSGVFMEYNDHTMSAASSTIASRSFDPDDPYAPCTQVAEKYQQACYFEQAAWWYRSLKNSPRDAGALCESVNDRRQYEACYRGLGNVLGPAADYDAKTAVSYCEEVESADGRNLCRQGLAWIMLADPKGAKDAALICDQDDPAQRSVCMAGAQIIK